MSAPRPIVPGATYMVSRRVTQRMFMLTPSALVNAIFLYCLAFAAWRTGVEIHGFVQMANHWHGVVTDPLGKLPEFLQRMHRLVARAMNAVLGRRENFWSSEPPSYVRLENAEDVLEKLAYMSVNPVAAGLVDDPKTWPGMITTRLGDVRVARRPETFFRATGTMPAEVPLTCTLPPALRHLGLEEANRRLDLLVLERVRREVNKHRQAGRKFAGAAAVRATSPFQRAANPERMYQRKPLFASSDDERRRDSCARLRAFRHAYRDAFERWRRGERRVRFPEGTYLMRVVHGVTCGRLDVRLR